MRRNKTTFVTIEWNKETGEDRELVITYNYYPGTNFIIHSASLEPNDPPELEVISAIMHSPTFHNREATEDVWDTLSDKDKEKIIEHCIEVENEDNREYERD